MNAGQQFELQVKQTKEAVTGMCFYIDKQVLHDVYQYYLSPDNLNNYHTYEINAHDIFEKVFDAGDILSVYIKNIIHSLHTTSAIYNGSSPELFYGLALHLLLSQRMLRKEILQINAKRFSTQKELYNRLCTAKQMMDDVQAETMQNTN
ncbi:MAG: hypothetical protein H7Y00_12705 [Fimbriimonadaceae bacterium]|nr:hypothetical protein [Chitinophagales bacterium]